MLKKIAAALDALANDKKPPKSGERQRARVARGPTAGRLGGCEGARPQRRRARASRSSTSPRPPGFPFWAPRGPPAPAAFGPHGPTTSTGCASPGWLPAPASRPPAPPAGDSVDGEKEGKEGKRKRAKKEHVEGMPKRPNSAYFMFAIDVRARAPEGSKVSPSAIGEQWSALSDADKKVRRPAHSEAGKPPADTLLRLLVVERVCTRPPAHCRPRSRYPIPALQPYYDKADAAMAEWHREMAKFAEEHGMPGEEQGSGERRARGSCEGRAGTAAVPAWLRRMSLTLAHR